MALVRAFFAVFVALSVALLPVQATFAHKGAPDVTYQVAAMDCCEGGAPCEKSRGDGCGSLAGCLAKCSAVTGTVAPHPSAPHALADAKLVTIADLSVPTGATAPPLPPPRV